MYSVEDGPPPRSVNKISVRLCPCVRFVRFFQSISKNRLHGETFKKADKTDTVKVFIYIFPPFVEVIVIE